MKASEELHAKLQKQRLRSEGVPGSPGADAPGGLSLPLPRGSLKSTPKVLGWSIFGLGSPRATENTPSPVGANTLKWSIQESGELTELELSNESSRGEVYKAKAGNMPSTTNASTPAVSSALRARGGRAAATAIKQYATTFTANLECKRRERVGGGGAQNDEVKQVSAKVAVEEAKNEELQRRVEQIRLQAEADATLMAERLAAAEEQMAAQAKEIEEYKRSVASLTKSNAELTAENKNLDEQLLKSRSTIDELTVEKTGLELLFDEKASSAPSTQQSGGSSESALRAVMAKPGATVEELRLAIKGVEALVSEAQRELERGEYRQKRAAYEKLHEVLAKAEEAQLEAAIAEAQRVGLSKEDIEKGEAKLLELRSMTDAERDTREAEKLKAALKPQLFLFVKKNDYASLEEELGKLPPETAWEDWKDHNGRTLIKYAKELRVFQVQEVLEALLAEKKPGAVTTEAPKMWSPLPVNEASVKAATRDSCSTVDTWGSLDKPGGAKTPETRTPSSGQASPERPSTPPLTSAKHSTRERRSSSTPSGPYGEEKKAAFKAAWTADEEGLKAALEGVPTEVWSTWTNAGGQELLEMSKSRDEYLGSSIHKVLLNMLGLIIERKYEPLEEGQAVWVFFAGDVMPRQATVREDTLAEAEKVLVQYWDGKDDEPPEYVDRCVVSIMGS